jgi:hypothetical protein
MKKIYALVTGLALGLGVLMGSAAAGEKFTLLKNIPAQALSQTEMAAVEGQGLAWSNIGWLYLSPINNYLYAQGGQFVGWCGYGGCNTYYGITVYGVIR